MNICTAKLETQERAFWAALAGVSYTLEGVNDSTMRLTINSNIEHGKLKVLRQFKP